MQNTNNYIKQFCKIQQLAVYISILLLYLTPNDNDLTKQSTLYKRFEIKSKKYPLIMKYNLIITIKKNLKNKMFYENDRCVNTLI